MARDKRPVKQVIVIRKDLKMRRGKEVAQGSHASMAWLTRRLQRQFENHGGCSLFDFSEAEMDWMRGSFRKITCQVGSEEELKVLAAAAVAEGVEAHLIVDSGLTEFNGIPTPTAVGIGPDYDDVVDKITKDLKLY